MSSSPPILDYATPASRPAPGVTALAVVATVLGITLAVVLAAPAFAPAWGHQANNPGFAILATAGALFYIWRRLWYSKDGAWSIPQGILATVAVLAVASQVVALKNDPGHPHPLLRLELFQPSGIAAGAILLFGLTRLCLWLKGSSAAAREPAAY